MILRDQRLALLLASLTLTTVAAARDSAARLASATQLAVPHSLNLELDYRAKRRSRPLRRFETPDFLSPTPELTPLHWPRNSDMRARLLTPELQRAPLVGWIATNLYRSRRETGWCLELDPGEGEYMVYYRLHLAR